MMVGGYVFKKKLLFHDKAGLKNGTNSNISSQIGCQMFRQAINRVEKIAIFGPT